MKLSDRYKELSDAERESLAKAVGISAGYLWQLATGWVRPDRGKRVQPSIELMAALVAADSALSIGDLVAEFAQPAREAA